MVSTLDRPTALGDVSNSGNSAIESGLPYTVEIEVTGVAPILFHRWQNEDVETRAKAAKNSKAKKTDVLENYVYRCENGNLGIPGTYLVGTLINPKNGAAKYRQDPRSPRKSALDLFAAAVQPLTEVADLGVADWDYEDRRRAVVQRNGITRVRPALHAGWKATFQLLITMPEYISPSDLYDTVALAGRAVGFADFRPTYGRFNITGYRVLDN